MDERELLLKINELIRKAENKELTMEQAIYNIKVSMPNDRQIREYFTFYSGRTLQFYNEFDSIK